MRDGDMVETGGGQRQVERVFHVLGFHRGAELPGHDVAGIVVKNRRQIISAPANDLEIGKVGLPQPVRRRRLVARSEHDQTTISRPSFCRL